MDYTNIEKQILTEYKEELERITSSDDDSLKAVYKISEKDLMAATESRRQFYNYAEKIHADISKCLDKDEMTKEERSDILDREMEILKIVGEKDSEIREHEAETLRTVEKKDSEKRLFGWCTIGTVSAVVVGALGCCVRIFGGNANYYRPHDLDKYLGHKQNCIRSNHSGYPSDYFYANKKERLLNP